MATRVKELWADRGNQAHYFKWLLSYSKPYAGRIILKMLMELGVTGMSLVMVAYSKRIIDNATTGNKFVSFLIVYVCLMIAVLFVENILTLITTILNEKYSFGIRLQVYNKIIRSNWSTVEKYHTGDLMTRLTSDAGNVADGIINTIPQVLRLVIELVVVFFMLFSYSPLLACLGLCVAPVAGIASWWLGKKIKRLQVKVQESEAKYRSFLQESLANLLIVKSFRNENYASDRLTELRESRFFWVFKKTKMSMASSVAMSLAFQIGYIAAFAYGALLIYRGEITYGTMTVFLTLVNRVQAPVMGLAQKVPLIVMILASAGRIIELQNIEMEPVAENVLERKEIGVKIDDLSFGYTDETIIENASVDIKPGEFMAIVGESGIGKTTLVRIMMSFLDKYSGQITYYDDKGNKEDNNAGIRDYISYVPQGNTLFSGTIRENIRMGKIDATEEEMLEALKLSAGYEFVMSLPKGLDTVIGERGFGLSEGQAQRIAIARAFIRKAPFLILDEATSALDEGTEQQVITGLMNLTPRPTCVIITHRKSILKYCDRQLLIDKKVQCVDLGGER
ncbi:MAG: ABC transporter ATP-binding protein/permease [Lachnospiraceae bacterium]|nr:ABC transporter ATP-binding protein/permease [Lachnospiraceae bacterium]